MKKIKNAFTLAETLITLVIIGTVAAMTIPALNNSIENKANQAQAKKAYSVINQALDKTKLTMGYVPRCYYWDSNAYGGLTCSEKGEYGECKKYTLGDGSPLPSDYNGPYKDCPAFFKAFQKELNVVKTCNGSALSKGCISPQMKGNDTVLKSNDSTATDAKAAALTGGCSSFRESNLQKNSTAWVLADGMIIIPYSLSNYPILLIDVNGKKGPNKWGYDIMTFSLRGGNGESSFRTTAGGCMVVEKGGKYTASILSD